MIDLNTELKKEILRLHFFNCLNIDIDLTDKMIESKDIDTLILYQDILKEHRVTNSLAERLKTNLVKRELELMYSYIQGKEFEIRDHYDKVVMNLIMQNETFRILRKKLNQIKFPISKSMIKDISEVEYLKKVF